MSGTVTVAPAANADTGRVLNAHDFPSGAVLIQAEKGWFLAAREVSGTVTVAPAAGPLSCQKKPCVTLVSGCPTKLIVYSAGPIAGGVSDGSVMTVLAVGGPLVESIRVVA